MEETIQFLITASTDKVRSEVRNIIEVDKDDLEGIPEEDWEDYVWEHLGGKEEAYQLVNINISRI